MNKFAIVLSAALVFLLSCTRETDQVFLPGESVTFTAGWAETDNTRTILQPDGTSVWWEPGAQINVFFGDKASGRFTSTNSQAQAIVDFTGSLPIVVGSVETDNPAHAYWAVYPYDSANTCDGESVTLTIPSTQTAIEGTFANKMFPSIATSTNFYLAFYNVCGGVRFTVANEGISSVTFKASNGESLVGKVQVGFNGVPVIKKVTEGSTEVTVNAPSGGFIPGKEYFATILPQTLSKGVTLMFKKTNGTVASTSIDNVITVNRSRFGTLTEKDKDLVFQGEIPVSSIELNQTSVRLREGETVTLVATVKPDNATDKTITWSSSDSNVLTVDNTGKVTALKEGKASIIASAGKITASCMVTVLSRNFQPNSEYLSFTGQTEDASISYEGDVDRMQFSYDAINWYDWGGGWIGLNNGTKVFVRAMERGLTNPLHFKMTGLVAANGNIMSLECGRGNYDQGDDDYGDFSMISRAWQNFSRLFKDCSSLTKAPDLPATELVEECYLRMFEGCTNLSAVPDLPATVLPKSCYEKMFLGCTSLTKAPAILANSAAKRSCAEMFARCTNLSVVPDLTIKTIGKECYKNMFSNCTALTQAPAILATVTDDYSFHSMFENCTNLTTVPDFPEAFLGKWCCFRMFADCTSLTKAPALPTTTLAQSCYGSMFSDCTNLTDAPALPATTLADGCYGSMFSDCTSLTNAPALPATTLAQGCYSYMFLGCTNLTEAPALPATTLADGCYGSMFSDCTNLTKAPALPATSLADGCYNLMFAGCTSLTKAPALPATTLAKDCYVRMFIRCTNLIDAPALPATTLAQNCYGYMFSDCTSLTKAPVLPATTLAPGCYSGMFYSCESLSFVKMMAVNLLTVDTNNYWLEGVSYVGTFVKNAAATWEEDGIIPSGWTVITATE